MKEADETIPLRRRRRRGRMITMVNGRECVGEERTITTEELGDDLLNRSTKQGRPGRGASVQP